MEELRLVRKLSSDDLPMGIDRVHRYRKRKNKTATLGNHGEHTPWFTKRPWDARKG